MCWRAISWYDIIYRNAMSFIDDILIYSETFEDHMRDLEEFFLRLRTFHIM
jgi:hypothetical protein